MQILHSFFFLLNYMIQRINVAKIIIIIAFVPYSLFSTSRKQEITSAGVCIFFNCLLLFDVEECTTYHLERRQRFQPNSYLDEQSDESKASLLCLLSVSGKVTL